MYYYYRNTWNVAFWIFSCRTLNNFYQLIVIIVIYFIMSECHDNFTENFTVLFSNAGKIGNVPGFECDNFSETIFWRQCKCNIYIVAASALDFKQLNIFYKFYLIKRIFSSERITYSAETSKYGESLDITC